MEIFKFANEIEKVYEDLIKNAKEDNLSELRALRNNQEKMMEFALNQKQQIVNLALKNVAEEVDIEINNFKNLLNQNIKNIEEQFQNNKNSIIKSIIQKLGLEF